MRFLIGVIDNETDSSVADEVAAIDAVTARLRSAGQLVTAEGPASPRVSVVIDNRGGAGVVTRGPLHETSQHVTGFWIVVAANRDAALSLAVDGSRACNRVVELRPFFGEENGSNL